MSYASKEARFGALFLGITTLAACTAEALYVESHKKSDTSPPAPKDPVLAGNVQIENPLGVRMPSEKERQFQRLMAWADSLPANSELPILQCEPDHCQNLSNPDKGNYVRTLPTVNSRIVGTINAGTVFDYSEAVMVRTFNPDGSTRFTIWAANPTEAVSKKSYLGFVGIELNGEAMVRNLRSGIFRVVGQIPLSNGFFSKS